MNTKALPAPPVFLSLPDYTNDINPHKFVEREYFDEFESELRELVSKAAVDLGTQREAIEKCRRLIAKESANNSAYRSLWSTVVEGASLSINPIPVRKSRRLLSDAHALQKDWLDSFSDAQRVWNTIMATIPKVTAKSK